ncbi:beta-phosphoglucomutase [Lacihabitans sp. CCS-44]|uniref:beta-phosphoglucomutase n=1 Tax=Lacihabitans sp. CCS-44 TaxID=2487331 RepID=UPI0020CC235B|nr:beta-phosphoglucomutase [Lacihabitans sp. CCS-44]MCP9756919.1 beta-phosphoglucomutase [Lacihabitans sp. CCS-44]
MIKAFLFDLDGVIVDTAVFHYKAWKRLANQLNFDIDEEFNETLKGISRMDSLDAILKHGGVSLSQEEKEKYAKIKNDWYLELVNQMTVNDILPGVEIFLKESRNLGIKIALGSASKNASLILEKTGILGLFDALIDGNHVSKSKPDPEVFLKGAEALEVEYDACVVFEDAYAGVQAAKAAGMVAVGIGSCEVLNNADFVVKGLFEMSPSEIITKIL